MTDNSFDNFIKNKLTDHASPVPADMWDRIQQKDSERRGAFWWKNYAFMFLLITAAIVGGVLWTNVSDKDGGKALDKTSPGIAIAENQDNISSSKQLAKTEPASTLTNPHAGDNSAKPASDNSGDRLTAPTDLATVTRKDKAHNLATGSSAKLIASTRRKNFSGAKFNVPAPSEENNQIVVNPQGSNLTLEEGEYSLQSFNKMYAGTLSTIAMQDKNLKALLLNPELSEHLKNYHLPCGIDCPSARGPRKNDWYLEVFASPDYAHKTILKGSGVSDEFLRRKDSSESFRGAFTAGFRISKTLGEKLMIKSGLQFSQINEKFSLRTENERRLTTVITIRTIIRAPGDTVLVRDTSTVEQIGYALKTTYNRYRSLDIPLVIGYEWGNDNLKASVNAGVILNVHSWQRGEMLDTSLSAVSFNKMTGGQVFKQNIGLGVYAGFSVIKRVSDKMEIFGEPYFRYNISNMTSDKSPFTQKFNVAGLNLGIRYKLSAPRQRY